MTKIFLFGSIIASFTLTGCNDSVNIDGQKLLMTQKMNQKIHAITKDLKDYCDTETYRKARLVANSILAKQHEKLSKTK